MAGETKTLSELIEEVCEDICDNYCKYRDDHNEDSLCCMIQEGRECPLDRLH